MVSEERKAYKKAWCEKNKERIAEQKREYYKNNKAKIAEHHKKWYETQSGKKSTTISHWKYRGLIHDDYSALYDVYIATTYCQVCQKEFREEHDRCMDHDHETGQFRHVLCWSCNTMDSWRLKI
jgi:DNA repair exonuclease SbcCD ATPase subunit